jgi:hypothetical protein
MYFRGEKYSVGFKNLKELMRKGTDLILIEKEGMAEVLRPFAGGAGIAVINSIGFVARYASKLASFSQETGANIVMITDFDVAGLSIARDLPLDSQLRAQNKSDKEIRDILNLELRTFQRYTKRIHDEDKEIWYSITSNEMASELLRLKGCLEHTYQKANEISEKKEDVGEVLEALNVKDNARVNIVMLLIEGPQLIKKYKGQLYLLLMPISTYHY